MNISVTSHWHLIPRGQRKHALQMLAAIDPKYVRVSSLQREVMDGNAVRELVGMGFRVIPVISGEKVGCLNEKQWADYVRRAADLMPKLGSRSVWVVQILNEPQTSRFWGRAPDPKAALKLFRIAVDILKSKHNCIILSPGLTNENKSDGKTKMSARKFLEVWVDADAPADFWALHYYQAEKKYAKVFKDNCNFLVKNGRVPVCTETGGDVDWYNDICEDGFDYVPAGMCCWYTFNGHEGFNLVDGHLNGNSVYSAMKEDSQ